MSRKRERSVTDKDNTVSKRQHIDLNVTSNEDSEFRSYLQAGHNEMSHAYQSSRCIPYHLIEFMYQLDLFVFYLFRKSTYEYKKPLSLVFEDSENDKFNNIVLHNKNKSIHIQTENVDKYYMDYDICYARLFTKEKEKWTFFINNYFDSFVKHLISKSNNIIYLIIFTNAGLNLTEENKMKQGRSRSFYPFKFDSIKMGECDILKDFLFVNDCEERHVLYQFSTEGRTREELF